MKCPGQTNQWSQKGAEEREELTVTINRYGASFQGDKNVQELASGNGCPTCKYTKAYRILLESGESYAM